MVGTQLGHYRIQRKLGEGGPASARAQDVTRELWRGLAVAQVRTR